jgi:hypothetical protein
VGLKAGAVDFIFTKNNTNQRSFEFFGRTSTPPNQEAQAVRCLGFFVACIVLLIFSFQKIWTV